MGALDVFPPLAGQGSAQAQDLLAMMHLASAGVAEDPVEGGGSVARCGGTGPVPSRSRGHAPYRGIGVTRDPLLSYLYAAPAARQDNAEGAGLVDLASEMTPSDLAAAQAMVAWWKRAAP